MNEAPKDVAGDARAMFQLTDLVTEQIRKLSELHEEGILTEEEFSAKKAELLARL